MHENIWCKKSRVSKKEDWKKKESEKGGEMTSCSNWFRLDTWRKKEERERNREKKEKRKIRTYISTRSTLTPQGSVAVRRKSLCYKWRQSITRWNTFLPQKRKVSRTKSESTKIRRERKKREKAMRSRRTNWTGKGSGLIATRYSLLLVSPSFFLLLEARGRERREEWRERKKVERKRGNETRSDIKRVNEWPEESEWEWGRGEEERVRVREKEGEGRISERESRREKNMKREWESNDQRLLPGQSNEGKEQTRKKERSLRTEDYWLESWFVLNFFSSCSSIKGNQRTSTGSNQVNFSIRNKSVSEPEVWQGVRL